MSTSQEPSPDAMRKDLEAQPERQSAASREDLHPETRDFFARAGASHNEEAFAGTLATIPNAPPQPGDEIAATK